MNSKAPVNRVENALKDWQSKEDRFGKMFSDILKNKPFLKEKLNYFDAVKAKFAKTAGDEEKLTLRILRQQRNQIEKILYPNLLVRVLRRMILPVKQKQVAKQADHKAANNLHALKESVIKAGFDNLSNKLEQHIKEGPQEFSIPVSYYVNEKEKLEFSLLFARDNDGQYQFENYKAALQSENKPQENREQKFVFEPDNTLTATHAYNLLAGRSIQKECSNGEHSKRTSWVQLDFNDKDADGNHKLKEFHSFYGYHLQEAIKQLPLKELANAQQTESMVTALTNGDRQAVTIQQGGKEQKFFIEANPQFKSFNIYDENFKKINISSVIGNKNVVSLKVKNNIQHKTDQGKKNGLAL